MTTFYNQRFKIGGVAVFIFVLILFWRILHTSAIVLVVKGEAQFRSSSSAPWVYLHIGTMLNPSAEIRTEKGARVDLLVKENGRVRVTESTQVPLEKILAAGR